jgi:glycosyltransferase involved in cell wall biosynthesis
MPVQVSVILPTYNRSHSLIAACTSVLTQSFKDLELIVVDDGSVEDVESLVKSLADPRVRFIRRQRNGGAAAARNTGLAEATGEYIAFQDSDDLWLPNKLEKQMKLLSSLPPGVGAVTGAKILYGRDENFQFGPGKVTCAPSPAGCLQLAEDQLNHILRENRISLQNTLFRRDCYPQKIWFDPCARANEDWEFAIRLIQSTKVYEDIEPVVVGFISKDSISTSSRKQCIGILRILKRNRSLLSAYRHQHSTMLMDIGAALIKTKKPRLGTRFLYRAVQAYPLNSLALIKTFLRKIGKVLR